SLAVHVRQMTVGRLDDVGERDRLRTLRAADLHVRPRSQCGLSRPRHPDRARGARHHWARRPTSTWALNGERHEDSITISATAYASGSRAGLSDSSGNERIGTATEGVDGGAAKGL